jgi:hypothetical protein
MTNIVDIKKAQAALDRAAVSKDRAGRFLLEDRLPPIKSSVIARIDYDDDTSELDITFATNKKYRYFAVPSDIYYDFVDASSKGEFFNARIRDRYAFAEVRPGRSGA